MLANTEEASDIRALHRKHKHLSSSFYFPVDCVVADRFFVLKLVQSDHICRQLLMALYEHNYSHF